MAVEAVSVLHTYVGLRSPLAFPRVSDGARVNQPAPRFLPRRRRAPIEEARARPSIQSANGPAAIFRLAAADAARNTPVNGEIELGDITAGPPGEPSSPATADDDGLGGGFVVPITSTPYSRTCPADSSAGSTDASILAKYASHESSTL